MGDSNYFAKGEESRAVKKINHCILCCKKRNLLFHHSDNLYIYQICVKCLDAEGEKDEAN